MHDLDRTLRAYEPELGDELEAFDHEGPFSAGDELELAAEMLSLESEAELDHFLGKLFKKAGGFKGVFRSLGKVLKPVAKTLLPIAGKAVGTFFGGPVGGALGGKLGTLATKLFEVDLESVDPSQHEVELARRFVRLAGSAAQAASGALAGGSPMSSAKAAVAAAAQQHAPGLLRGQFGRRLLAGGAAGGVGVGSAVGLDARRGCSCGDKRPTRKGRWVRRGGKVIVLLEA